MIIETTKTETILQDIPVPSYWVYADKDGTYPQIGVKKIISETQTIEVGSRGVEFGEVRHFGIWSPNYVQCEPEIFDQQLADRMAAFKHASCIEVLQMVDNTSNPES